MPILLLFVAGCHTTENAPAARSRWTTEQAKAWYSKQKWLVGCNYIPSSAINQLEMWQADTWDPKTIDRELGWAEDLGFTSVRVFLHDLMWQQDKRGFVRRMEQFLDLAEKHRIGVMFVLFDSVWDPFPKAGKQREPRPHIHNSGWVQSPGMAGLTNMASRASLKAYVQGVIGRFRDDPRVQVWDIYNEPDNPVPQYRDVELKNKAEVSLALLREAFVWARAVNPSQPISSGVWIGNWGDEAKLSPTERCQLEESDVITFHSYGPLDQVKKCVENLKRYQRPILCTEYMARPMGSRFDPILGYFKAERVGAYNWGFVDGKSQTIYPWDSWKKQYTAEPPVWFHDIFRRDGTPYDPAEVSYIRSLTGAPRRSGASKFQNPINGGPDPWIVFHEGNYYLTTTQGDAIRMWRADRLAGLKNARPVTVWQDAEPTRSRGIWAPEFHLIGDHWYIYYTATSSDNKDDNHRMHVLESAGRNPLGPYQYKGRLFNRTNDQYAIDGTVFQKKDGSLYFAWAAQPGHVLYIAKMANPYMLEGDGVNIPANGFGCSEVREGPVVLQRNGKLFLVYSACDTGKPDYKLGMLVADEQSDPLDPRSWTQVPTPVFQRNDAHGVFGPGHNAFFRSPDGTEDWIVYHGKTASNYTYQGRTTRAQKFGWTAGGMPDFGTPLPLDTALDEPSAQRN